MNVRAIADAIAARYSGITVTVNSEVESLGTGPTAELPPNITRNALLVFPPVEEYDYYPSRQRIGTADFSVRLYRRPEADMGRRSRYAYAWRDALTDKVEGNLDLDLAYVTHALDVGGRINLDDASYADETMDMVERTIRVHIKEVVTALAV
jgi:hypothetical protein